MDKKYTKLLRTLNENFIAFDYDHEVLTHFQTRADGMKWKNHKNAPDSYYLVKTKHRLLKGDTASDGSDSLSKHLNSQPFPHRDGPHYSVHKESVELDEGIVNKFVDKGLNKVLDKLEKMTGKHLGFVKKSTVPSAGKDRGNEYVKFKKEAEDFHRKAKKQWTYSKREVGDSFKYYGTGKIPTEQKEAVSDLQAEMQKIIDMHTQLEKMMQTTGNSPKYQRTMEKLDRDTSRVFKEISKVTEKGNAKYRAMQGMDNLRKAKKMTHKEPRQINPVKFRAYANRGESVELDEKAPKIDPVKYAAHMNRNKKPKKISSTKKTLSDISKRADKMSRESVELDESVYDKKLAQAWKKVKSVPNVRGISNSGQNHAKKLSSLLKGSPNKLTFEKLELALGTYETHAYKAAKDKKNPHGKEDLPKLQEFCDSVDEVIGAMKNLHQSQLPEGFMDKMKQLVPGAKGKPQKLPKGKKTAMEMQFPYARLSIHRMIEALRKAKNTAMKGKAQGKDRRENERSLGYILKVVEEIARTRHAEQPNSGRQIHDVMNIDDETQSYFMNKIRQNDWTKTDQEILDAMVGNGTDDNTKGGAYAKNLAHDLALSVKYAKKDAGIRESVEVNEDHCLVCKDCGDELNKPTTDCENDCSDPNGSHWVKEYNEATEVDELAQIDAQLKAIKDRMIEKTQNENYELTEDDLPEAWTPGMRRAAARRMKVLAPRIKLGIKRSKNRTATKEKLMNRAVRKVKSDLIKKFTKGSSKTDLSPARRADMEKRIAKLGPRIKQLAQKQLPATRRMEVDRKRNRNK